MTPGEQQRLAKELAVWLADRVRRYGTFVAAPGGALLDSATSPLAGACYTLWALGLATITDAHGNPPSGRHGAPPAHFRLADAADIRPVLEGQRIAPKDFSRLIGQFLALHTYEPEAFELNANWFRPTLPVSLLEAFGEAGFLDGSPDRCRWTDVMAQWVEWSSPHHGWETPAETEARHLREYGPVWKAMPPPIRERVVERGRLNKLLLVDAIRRYWDDGEWSLQQLPDWEDPQRLVEAMHIGDQLEQLLHARRLRLYWLYPGYKLGRWFRRRL